MKQTILQKLMSRKFWVAVAGIVSGLVMIFDYAESDAETIAGAVLTIGSAVAYMVAEGVIDAANVGKILVGAETIVDEIKDGNNETNGKDGGENDGV